MDTTLIEYLSGHGIRTWPAAGQEVTAHCFLGCDLTRTKGKGKLYLNTATWLYDCKVCGSQGGRKRLREHFGDRDDEQPTWLPGANPATRMKLLREYTDHAAQLLAGNDAHLLYLLRRGLSAETIVDAKLGWVPRGYGVCGSLDGDYDPADLKAAGLVSAQGTEFHAGRITIPYLHRGGVLQVRGKDPDSGRYYTPAGDSVRLFNADSLCGAENVMVVEGEFDALAAAQALRLHPRSRYAGTAVVGLPGAGAWPGGREGFADYFREAKRIFIALDPDETGIREATNLKDVLGSRARLVVLPRDEAMCDTRGQVVKCDWTEFLRAKAPDHPWGGHAGADIDDLLAEADMAGKRIFSIGDAQSRWRQDREERPGIKLGWPSLDAVIAPGLKGGNVCIPMAKTGVGKTVFLANLLYNTRDRRVLHITLENTVTEVFELLWRINHFWNPLADDVDIQTMLPKLRIVDENRLNPDDIELLAAEYAAEVGEPPELINIDYLGYLAAGRPGNGQYEKVSNAVMDLKAAAKRTNAAIISPCQVNRGAKAGKAFEGDEARDSGVVEETADFAFGLYRPGEAVDAAREGATGAVTDELNAQVIKSRRGGKGRIAKLAMSSASLVIADARDTMAVHRIQMENASLNRGLTYDQIVAASRTVALNRAQLRLV